MKRKFSKVRFVLLLFLLSILFLILWSFVIEPRLLVIHQQTIHVAGWPSKFGELKVAALSDIHAGSPHVSLSRVDSIVARTNELKPDLILLLGDYISRESQSHRYMEPEKVAKIFSRFEAPLGTIAVLGNHDWWFSGDRSRLALEKNGIVVLENEPRAIQRNGTQIWIYGVADLWTRHPDFGRLEEVPSGDFVIAITHNPDIFPRAPDRVRLTLAGHTHGGQVNLPFFGRPWLSSPYGQKYAAGLIREGDQQLFITTGIGTSIAPVRFRVPPEISLLTIGP